MTSLIDIFEKEVKVVYKDELYSVRDNGAVMRHSKGEKIRKNDNIWTFGLIDKNTKYLIHERTNQKLRRTINFGDIKDDSIKAAYSDGLLFVDVVLKKEEKVKKTIEIQ